MNGRWDKTVRNVGGGLRWIMGVHSIQQALSQYALRAEPAGQGQRSASCLAVENLAHCEFPLLRDLLIR